MLLENNMIIHWFSTIWTKCQLFCGGPTTQGPNAEGLNVEDPNAEGPNTEGPNTEGPSPRPLGLNLGRSQVVAVLPRVE